MKTCHIFCYIPCRKGWKNVTVSFDTCEEPLTALYDLTEVHLTHGGDWIPIEEIYAGNARKELDQMIDKADKKDYREYLQSLKSRKTGSAGANTSDSQRHAKKRTKQSTNRKSGK